MKKLKKLFPASFAANNCQQAESLITKQSVTWSPRKIYSVTKASNKHRKSEQKNKQNGVNNQINSKKRYRLLEKWTKWWRLVEHKPKSTNCQPKFHKHRTTAYLVLSANGNLRSLPHKDISLTAKILLISLKLLPLKQLHLSRLFLSLPSPCLQTWSTLLKVSYVGEQKFKIPRQVQFRSFRLNRHRSLRWVVSN